MKKKDLKSDENLIPLIISFGADRVGTYSGTIELKSLPDDIRIIPIDFRVTEAAVSEASVGYLTFNSSVFDQIVQNIPIVRAAFLFPLKLVLPDSNRSNINF